MLLSVVRSVAASSSMTKNNRQNGEEGSSGSSKTILWWCGLAGLSAFNILLWLWTCTVVEANDWYQRAHLALSGIYVMVCAYRSVLPRIDLERYCLVDTQLSSVFLGRAAATIAEVSFAAQLALILHEFGEVTGLTSPHALSFVIVPTLALAQVFCWYGVVTLDHLGHAIEESLWALSLAAVGMGLVPVVIYSNHDVAVSAATFGTVASAVYVAFMVTVDIPMYLERWRESQRKGHNILSVQVGRVDAWHRRVVTTDWKIWKPEVAWLTGYFSFAVWTSVALVHFPR